MYARKWRRENFARRYSDLRGNYSHDKNFGAARNKKIRLTGGEPLLRKNICALIGELKNIGGIERVALTTNGVLLPKFAKNLVAAGLDGINLSLDTLDEKIFSELTRRNFFLNVIAGIEILFAENFSNVKINCVAIRGFNDADILKLVELAKNNPVKVRFIELMPIGCAQNFTGVPTLEICALIEKSFGSLIPVTGKKSLCGPAKYFRGENFMGQIGFINALEHKFCGECNRIRLTAEGFLKPCLNFGTGLDVRKILRSGCSDEEIFSAIGQTIYNKPREHLFNRQNLQRDDRKMYQVGG